MRVTIVNQFYAPDISPTAQLSASVAEHRAARGDEVTVVAGGGGYVRVETGADQAAAANPRVTRIWTPGLGKASKLRRIVDYGCFYLGAAVRMLTMRRQDVVISMTTPPFIAWTGVLHKLLHPRCRLILWNMDCYPEVAERNGVIREGGLLSRAMRACNRALFRRLDHLVCLDTAMVELLMGSYAPDDGQSLSTTIIPNWERASMFPADAAPPRWEGAGRLGLTDRFLVLYLGNMGYGHGFETAIEAARRLEDEGVTFLFIGGGSRRDEIASLAKRIGAGNVLLHDYVPKQETPAVMAGAGAALITLRDEALGVMSPSKLHANLAMGLPIVYVGPTKSNVDDAIARFGCGVSLREGDVEGLVAFVRRLKEEASEHDRLRGRAREAFDAAYCDAVTLPQFDALLEAAAGEAGTPEAKAEVEAESESESASVAPAE